MFEGLSLTHILLFLVILLLLFGAKRLPEIGGALGKSIGEFKRSMRDVQNEFNASANQQARMEPPPPPSQPVPPQPPKAPGA
ncbi:MAG TPA: twin-arginine translocase TatA/TatE family subunit [Gemmatimonadales bacterium]|nr:twin-arginine translocase TatA/TatE family subunit [Gemmatimonadales bacterium]